MKISIVYTEDCVALTDFRALEPMMQRIALLRRAKLSFIQLNIKMSDIFTRRERLKSAPYLRLKKRRFETCVGSFHEKLLFPDLRLLLAKKLYSSDITSKVRI